MRCGDFHIFCLRLRLWPQVPGCRTGQHTKVILPAFVNTQSQYDNRDQGKYKIYSHLGLSGIDNEGNTIMKEMTCSDV